MNWFWAQLGKYFDKRNGIVRDPAPKQNFHWTKADKPLEEMTLEERKIFAEKLASESLKALTNDPNNSVTRKFKKTYLIAVLVSVLIAPLVLFNWDKVPKYGNNAKALTYAKLVCVNSKTIDLETRVTAAEKALNLDTAWERLANAYGDIFSSSEILKMMVTNGEEDSTEYRSQYSKLQRALVTANGICNGINLK